MPQITLEYTKNIDWDPYHFLKYAHESMVDIIDAKLERCKSRIICHDDFYIGDGKVENAFIFIRVEIIAGRSKELKNKLAEALLRLLSENLNEQIDQNNLQANIYVLDIAHDHYYAFI